MRDGYYVLVEVAGKPTFVVEDDGSTPLKFRTLHEAHELANHLGSARAYGYAVLNWPDGFPEAAEVSSAHPPVRGQE